MTKVWTLIVILGLVLAALAVPQRRLSWSETGVYSLECEVEDPADFLSMATEAKELEAWFEGSLLSPIGDVRCVVEGLAVPWDQVVWYGLYVDDELVAEAALQNGDIEVVDGRGHVRLEADVHPLFDRALRLETLDRHDNLATSRSYRASILGEVWDHLGSLEEIPPR